MKIAIIGYGKMGKAVEKAALERGHTIVSVIDAGNPEDFLSDAFAGADAAIEFTTPATAFGNCLKCFEAGVPVVSGTTGWQDRLGEIRRICEAGGKTFFYASNFSLGVNILFALNKYLARLMEGFPAYDVRITETHHVHKLDAPSGTAITLAEGIIENLSRKGRWVPETAVEPSDLPVRSIREGEVPGIHEVIYESAADTLGIRHEAKGRAGFALGAVVAAEFAAGRKGFLGMADLLRF